MYKYVISSDKHLRYVGTAKRKITRHGAICFPSGCEWEAEGVGWGLEGVGCYSERKTIFTDSLFRIVSVLTEKSV